MTNTWLRCVEPASLEDAVTLHGLRLQLENWLGGKGIEQWGRGYVSREEITEQIRAGQWHVVRDAALGVTAAARLLEFDPEVWGDDDRPAVYVHG